MLRGGIAFNIFIGMILVYIVWWLVRLLQMDLLSQLLTQFVSVGVLMLLIVFQPEVRRFLLILGNTTLKQRSNFIGRFLNKQLHVDEEVIDVGANDICLIGDFNAFANIRGELFAFKKEVIGKIG